jgi:thiol:disulfide interchange protein DsbD
VKQSGHLARFITVFALFLTVAGVTATAAPVKTDHVTADLVAEPGTLRPGQTHWVMLHLKLKEGWHTYWKNPGDSGQPPDIAWKLPDGVTAGDIEWPYPERLPYGPLLNYGYSDNAYHLVPIALSKDWPEGKPVALHATVNWLVCAEICVPESGSFDLSIPTSDTPRQTSLDAALLFQAARERLPVETDWSAGFAKTGDSFVLAVSGAGLQADKIKEANFFPYEWGLVEPSAPQTLGRAGDGISLTLTPGQKPDTEKFDGVLVFTEAGGDGPATRAIKISAKADDTIVAATPAAGALSSIWSGAGTGAAGDSVGVLSALLFAMLGGIILNLMPCVFPVLSMKAMALIRHAEKDPGTVRLHGLAYAVGVLLCFAVLAGILIALKSGGEAIGWGFQLQSPIFVAAMAYLFFLLGLNLSGVFAIGGSATGIGGSLATRDGYNGSFFTGILAAVVSTPCTAPFMGVALGYALTQPVAQSVSIFLALGVGFALPYLLLTFIPALVRLLPRPGAWMERTRQFLAFPLYASVAWLIWVLAIQTGPDGVFAALGGMVLIGFAIWLWNLARGSARGGTVPRILSLASVAGAIALVVGLDIMAPGSAATRIETTGQTANGPAYETFSAKRLAELRAAGTPVFINMTAAWCITCQVNDRVALASETVADQFRDLGIVYLKGDWTNGDPEITALLESFGRSGVPIYVLYGPGNAEPVVLPQLLTETIVLDALQDLSTTSKITAKSDGSSS